MTEIYRVPPRKHKGIQREHNSAADGTKNGSKPLIETKARERRHRDEGKRYARWRREVGWGGGGGGGWEVVVVPSNASFRSTDFLSLSKSTWPTDSWNRHCLQ